MARVARWEKPIPINRTIAAHLGAAILAGEYQPGEILEGEIEKSAALGVSRAPYREAIRTLVAKGLLECKPGTGTRVTPRHRWNLLDPDTLDWMLSYRPNISFVRDLFEVWRILEPSGASKAMDQLVL